MTDGNMIPPTPGYWWVRPFRPEGDPMIVRVTGEYRGRYQCEIIGYDEDVMIDADRFLAPVAPYQPPVAASPQDDAQ